MKKLITTAACLAALTLVSTAMAAPAMQTYSAGMNFFPENGTSITVSKPIFVRAIVGYIHHNLNKRISTGWAGFGYSFQKTNVILPYGSFELTVGSKAPVVVDYRMHQVSPGQFTMTYSNMPASCTVNHNVPSNFVKPQIHCA